MAKTGSEPPNEQVGNAPEPETAAEYIATGWSHYGKREFYRAEADFRKALDKDPDSVEANYALAVSMSASGRSQDAAKIFNRVIQMAESASPQEYIRAHMFAQMSKTHLNWGKPTETNPEKK